MCHSVQRRSHVTITHDTLDPAIQGPSVLVLPKTCNLTVQGPTGSLSVTSGGQDWKPVQTCLLQDPPLVLTSGGYWSTYGWQTDGTYPTGMLSCLNSFLHKPYSGKFFLDIMWQIIIVLSIEKCDEIYNKLQTNSITAWTKTPKTKHLTQKYSQNLTFIRDIYIYYRLSSDKYTSSIYLLFSTKDYI